MAILTVSDDREIFQQKHIGYESWLDGWLVGCLVCLFYATSTLTGLFNAEAVFPQTVIIKNYYSLL